MASASAEPLDPSFDDLPLVVAFYKAQRLYMCITSGSANVDDKRDAAALLTRCTSLVESLALFSRNETLEDVTTGDLKYLLVGFYLAEILSSMASTDLKQRVQQVNSALQHYRDFLDKCDQYDLLGSNQVVYHREEEGIPIDANTKRMLKIDRFKRQKGIDAQIAVIEGKRKQTTDLEEEAEGQDAGLGGLDEDELRRLLLLQIDQAVIRTLETRPVLKQEAEMLEMRIEAESRATPQQIQEEANRRRQEQRAKKEMLQHLHGIMANLDTSKKQQLQRDVFRPSFAPATVTVEEAGEMELRDAQAREARQKLVEDKRRMEEEEMNEEELEDREVAKQRAWDDWKDDNPKGWGNSKLRPCA